MTDKITGINLSPQDIQKLKSSAKDLPKVTPETIKEWGLALKSTKGPSRDEFVKTLTKPIGEFKKDLMPLIAFEPMEGNRVVNILKKMIRFLK